MYKHTPTLEKNAVEKIGHLHYHVLFCILGMYGDYDSSYLFVKNLLHTGHINMSSIRANIKYYDGPTFNSLKNCIVHPYCTLKINGYEVASSYY